MIRRVFNLFRSNDNETKTNTKNEPTSNTRKSADETSNTGETDANMSNSDSSDRTITAHDGTTHVVGDEINGGKEGTVYSLVDEDNVVKILDSENRSSELESKLEVMINNPPKGTDEHGYFAWPNKILYRDGDFIGYSMPEIDMSEYTTVRTYQDELTGDDPMERDRIRLVTNIAAAVTAVHQKNYAVGDFNWNNLLINSNQEPVFIDCDSFTITDPDTGEVYYGSTKGNEVQAPEGRPNTSVVHEQQADNFCLAFRIFLLLVDNYPYQARGRLSEVGAVSDVVDENPYTYWSSEDGVLEPSIVTAYENLSTPIKFLFESTFMNGKYHAVKRPTARVWWATLVGELDKIENTHRSHKISFAVNDSKTNAGFNTEFTTDDLAPDTESLDSGLESNTDTTPATEKGNSKSYTVMSVESTRDDTHLSGNDTHVCVSGVIYSQSRIGEFTRNGEKRYITSAYLFDYESDAMVRVNFWNGLALRADRSLVKGPTVTVKGRIESGYDDNIKYEIHADDFSIKYDTDHYQNTVSENIPTIHTNTDLPSLYTNDDNTADMHVRGTIVHLTELHEDTRTNFDGEKYIHKQIDCVVVNGTGHYTIRFLNTNAERMVAARPGQTVEITTGKVQKIHPHPYISYSGSYNPPSITNIALECKPDTKRVDAIDTDDAGDLVDLAGRIEEMNGVKDTSAGELQEFTLTTMHGKIEVNLWKDDIDRELSVDDRVILLNMRLQHSDYATLNNGIQAVSKKNSTEEGYFDMMTKVITI